MKSEDLKTSESWASWIVVLGCALFIVVARLHTYHEPPERDLMTYAVFGHEMLEGRALYSELWDHKPPAVYVTYMLAEMLAGYGPGAIYLLNVLGALAVLGAAWRAGGWLAAVLWALLGSDLYLQANQPNVELFINAAMAWAFVLLLGGGTGARVWARPVLLAGAMFALASLYKPVSLAPTVLMAVAYCARPPGVVSRGLALKRVLLMAGMGVAAWVVICMYYVATGRGEIWWMTIVDFNRWYASVVFEQSSAIDRLMPAEIVFTIPLMILTMFAIARRWRSDAPLTRLLLAWAVGTFAAVTAPAQAHAHYFQLLLPPLCVGAAMGIASLPRARFPRLAPGVAGAILAFLIWRQLSQFALTADQWSIEKYGPICLDVYAAATQIDRNLPPGQTFFTISDEIGLYWYTRRPMPSGIIKFRAVGDGPLSQKLTDQLLKDLESSQPAAILAQPAVYDAFDRAHPLIRWIDDRYVEIDTVKIDNFRWLMRRAVGKTD